MTGWSSLPYEMKCEVFKYLDKTDRFKFASCNFQCFREVFLEEKDIRSVGLEKITQLETIRPYFVVTIDDSQIRFEQIANMCEIKYDDYVLGRGFGKIENTVYKFFKNIWGKHRKTIEKLKLSDVDLTVIEDLSKIKKLEITTSNRVQLYNILSETRYLRELVVNFKQLDEAEKMEEINLPKTFEWSSIRYVNLRCNAAEIAWELLDNIRKSKYKPPSLAFSISGGDWSDSDSRRIDILGKFVTIDTDLPLTADQFVQLTSSPSVKDLKFDASNIEPSVIIEWLLAFDSAAKKKFKFTNFHEFVQFEEHIMGKFRSSGKLPSFEYSYNRSNNILSIVWDPWASRVRRQT